MGQYAHSSKCKQPLVPPPSCSRGIALRAIGFRVASCWLILGVCVCVRVMQVKQSRWKKAKRSVIQKVNTIGAVYRAAANNGACLTQHSPATLYSASPACHHTQNV
jgi:hypothetical protein